MKQETEYNINVNNFIQVLQETLRYAEELKDSGCDLADCEKDTIKALHSLI